MQQVGLTCRRKPRYVHTTDSHHGEPVYANLVKNLVIETPNQCWGADLTFVRLPEGFVYLACLVDAYSRKCIGWSLARRMESSLPLQALEMALAQRKTRSWVDSPFRPRTATVQFRLRQSVAEGGLPGQSVCTGTTY